MANNRYITPQDFRARVRNGSLIRLGISLSDYQMEYGERLINALRPINKKDPGFKYSCECVTGGTRWMFGYTDREVYMEADALSDEHILAARKELGIIEENISGTSLLVGSPCVCPFNPSGE